MIALPLLDKASGQWRLVREVDLPFDPRIAGEGLNQSMSVEEMNARFAQVLTSAPRRIDLDGLVTDHLRVECDREHPVWPSHGECNGGAFNVPFGILNTLTAHGEPLETQIATPAYHPPLTPAGFAPAAPPGMTLTQRPHMLLFAGERLSVGFSLVRPMLMHLGWDAHDQGRGGQSRLLVSRTMGRLSALGGLSGPLLRRTDGDWGAHQWTGEVEARGNRVAYRHLRAVAGLTIDAIFTVEPDRLILELTQRCEHPMPALEAEAWRLAWDLAQGITGAMAMPTLWPGRNGEVMLPALWATDAVGCLAMQPLGGAPRMQVDSYRAHTALTGGFVLAPRPGTDASVMLPAGEQRAVLELAVSRLEPEGRPGGHLARGAASRWAGILACFRPEQGGFSNNAASVNCHLSQAAPLDLVARTRRPQRGPDPLDLARYTIERALLDGGGYGYCGLPCNLLPIHPDDHMLPSIVPDFAPTFETYTNGSLSAWPAAYYLRALSIHGLKDQARQLARELDEGYAAGMFDGGMGSGHEFRSWEGLPTGYEGTLIGCFAPLYAIAIEQGVIAPFEPEWWPEA